MCGGLGTYAPSLHRDSVCAVRMFVEDVVCIFNLCNITYYNILDYNTKDTLFIRLGKTVFIMEYHA